MDSNRNAVPGANAAERDAILRAVASVAVVGVSANPSRPSHDVAAYLLGTPLAVSFVNPSYDEVLGQRSYPSLADLPDVPDMVDIFRREEAIPGVVDEAIEVGAKVVWLQLGLRHDQAARKAMDAGLAVVQDRCLKVDYARWQRG